MSTSYQSEIPKARVNIQLNLHTGGAQKKIELPLKLLVVGDYSNGAEQRPLSEREPVNVNKNNFNSVLSGFSPALMRPGLRNASRSWACPIPGE